MGQPAAAEAASLLDSNATPPPPPQRPPRKAVVAGVALLAAVAAATARAPRPAPRLASNAMDIAVTGPYGANTAAQYPFLASGRYDALVEPHASTELRVAGAPRSAAAAVWTFGDGRAAPSGFAVNATFPALGEYRVSATAYDAGGRAVAAATALLVCRYARREIRQLTDGDRNRFLDAMQVLWSCRNCSDAYGPAYVDIYALTRQHAALAGDKACDHMHDGLGFLTMHLGLSLAFEQSIQAVDAAVALPYWDYTVDRYDADRGARPLGDSAMWRSDWFGTADPAVNTVATGRWAFVAAEQGAWDAPVHNSYGFLRAPWNNNDRPWVTRSDSLCGYDFEDTPSCAAHFALLNGTDSWFDFAWQLPYAPHGSVHQYVGGTLDCNDTATELLEFLRDEVDENKYPGFASTSSDLMYLLRTDMFLALKNLYRLDRLAFPAFCSPDAPYSDCASTCDYPTNLNQALAHNNTGAVEAFWGEMMAWDTAIAGSLQTISSRYDWLSEALKVKVMTHLCDAGFGTDGDHLEAASPLDPSFWPVHPTIERLYQYKQLSTGFSNESWPDENYAATAGCYGHARTDVVPFAFSLLEGRDGAPAAYTNEELLALASPREPNLPYVYADFDWAHCARAGYDFAALAAARTRR